MRGHTFWLDTASEHYTIRLSGNSQRMISLSNRLQFQPSSPELPAKSVANWQHFQVFPRVDFPAALMPVLTHRRTTSRSFWVRNSLSAWLAPSATVSAACNTLRLKPT